MIDGIGGIGYDLSAGGLALGDNNRRPRLFKITAGSNPYTASEVVLLETDGSKSNTGVYDVTAAQKVLWEVNGNTSVPVNTIVEATPNAAGLGFYFKWQPSISVTANMNQRFPDFTLNQSTGVYQDVLVTNLTTPGTYLIWCQAMAAMNSNTAGDRILGRLSFNGQNTSGVVDFPLLTTQTTSVEVQQTGGCITLCVSNGGLSITLQACRTFAGTVTTSYIGGSKIGLNYSTTVAWLRVS